MLIADFMTKVLAVYKTGAATEHSYRSAIESLFNALNDSVTALNEPKRVKCGAPDFIVYSNEIVIGHIEAKDLGLNIRAMKDSNKEQQQRYLKALPNLIYTNCLDWDFYRNGERFASVTIADYPMGVQPRPEEYDHLENLLREFISQKPQTITSSRTLAMMMAGKATLIKDILFKVLREDKEFRTDLGGQYKAFREHLIHDIKPEDFADIYAETIAYGMFAARLHDTTLDTFTRQEALELLPKTNPFLRNLFSYVAGPNLDDSIRWIIDDLANVFQAANVGALMKDFGKLTGQNDPFLHFYEVFLAAYNPTKRKARGVWYTPESIVNFIVRAVNEVLCTEFGLVDGLADTSKVTIDFDTGQNDSKGKPITHKRSIHRVQILDPATGTGTFLAQAIKQISPKVKDMAEGMWSGYIEHDLIPRLHGFELLMASYAMCHMKLDMILTELGYTPSKSPPRLSVYLTNSLEEGERDVRDLFMAQWLTREAQEANVIKRDMPIMCVIGNPPYSGVSSNKGEWAKNLIAPYKMEPGGKVKLKERNPKWLNDDYVKFIRFAEHMISKTGEGVLGFITNHGYIDNPTFRGMRWHLLRTFDKIYVIDLHGNSKKKEVAPNGKADQNVFDIQQGVAIIIGVKHKNSSKELAQVMHMNIWGTRAEKYICLADDSKPALTGLSPVEIKAPNFFLKPWNYAKTKQWEQGFSIDEFMPINSNGIVTGDDKTLVSHDRDTLRINVTKKYGVFDSNYVQKLNYRQFETSYLYNDASKVARGRKSVMRHYSFQPQLGLLVTKQVRDFEFAHVFVTDAPSEAIFLSGKTATNAMNAPLYLYPEDQDLDKTRRVNFDAKLWEKLRGKAKDATHGEPDELAVFDYIYGVLHCPDYRKTFSEFLKIGFPRIPWPASTQEFWDVTERGNKLRRLHLMMPDAIGDTPYPFHGKGDGLVTKPRFKDSMVWINDTQYFSDVPQSAWNTLIGGYQPAQKWLKDRKGRLLTFDDVKQYQRIVKVLIETARVMDKITMTLK